MPAELFEFEDFELDRSACELRRAGIVVHLERIPLELLFLLIERRGQLVMRQEIFERIWGKNVFLDVDNSINIAVRKLRHALNDEPDAPRFVVTVPAKGYRFIAPIREEVSAPPVPEAGFVSAVVDVSPTADATDASSTMITKADMSVPKDRRRGILSSIIGTAFLIAVIVLIEQLSLRPPATTASIPPARPPALPLPNMPSIAVLPFINLSGDRDQEYFSDGITNDLITALSRLPHLFVIARSSTFTYKGKAAKVQDVSRQLGVQYVLEGSVRKAGDQVRITAELVDATTGADLWAVRYDRPLRDIFALQDEIVRRIVTTLNLQLDLMQQGFDVRQTTDNLEAYDDFLRGVVHIWDPTKDDTAKAREMFEKAIELDPKYARAYALLGYSYFWDWVFFWSNDPHTLDRALQLEQLAIALDKSLAFAHMVLGEVYLYKKQFDPATTEAERAIALDPNSAFGYNALAFIMNESGKPADAIGVAEKAMRLDPQNREAYLSHEGFSYTQMGRYAEAIPVLKRNLARYPNFLGAHYLLAIDYIELGREGEARAEAAEVLRINPQFSLQVIAQRAPQKDESWNKRAVADARKAGLK